MNKIFAIVASMFMASANAEFISGNHLLQKIESSDPFERGVAAGYVAGVFDATLKVYQCAPATVSLRQVVDLTHSILMERPDMREKSADIYVVSGLQRVWPCPKRSKGEKDA